MTERESRGALVVIAAVLGIWALRASAPVTLPLTFAALALAAIWPFKQWLEARLPAWLSLVVSILVLLLVILGFALALWVSAAQVLSELQAKSSALGEAYRALASMARSHGFIISDHLGHAAAILRRIALDGYRVIAFVGFVLILVVFALPEMAGAARIFAARFSTDTDERLRQGAEKIAAKVRRYLGVTFALSVITGLLCWGWAEAMGLRLAVTWGLLNFLLNFVPIVGNIIGTVPPSLYGFAQFGEGSHAAITAGGFVLIQLVVSNFLNPWMEGRSLSLSPLAIIVAIAFWGWVWGIGGALLAVPITSAGAIVLRAFERTRWIAELIALEARKARGREPI